MEILIIGGIAAGMSVAAKAMRVNKNARITVVEMENYISFGACGLPYYLGEQFDDENFMYARTAEQMRAEGLNVLLRHEAKSVNFEAKTVEIFDIENRETIFKKYDRLMIATGASAKLPPIVGLDSDNLYTITKPYSVNKLKANLDDYENIVVVGGGYIGVEVAEQLAHLNKNVRLIQSPNRLLNGPFDPEFSEKIKMALTEAGVIVNTGERVQEFVVKDQSITEVRTKDNSYVADAIIVAIGFKPNTDFLNGQLKTLENGAIIINQFGETSIKDVFSAGDCASVQHQFTGDQYIPLATYANKLGRLIGTNIVSDEKDWIPFKGALGTSAIKAGAYEAVVTGITEKEAKALNYDYKTTLIETNNHANYYPNQEKILIKLVYDAKTHVLYGAQLFGKNDTVLRATGLTTAIHAGLTTDDIGFIDYAYSPPFSSTWEALNVAANTAK